MRVAVASVSIECRSPFAGSATRELARRSPLLSRNIKVRARSSPAARSKRRCRSPSIPAVGPVPRLVETLMSFTHMGAGSHEAGFCQSNGEMVAAATIHVPRVFLADLRFFFADGGAGSRAYRRFRPVVACGASPLAALLALVLLLALQPCFGLCEAVAERPLDCRLRLPVLVRGAEVLSRCREPLVLLIFLERCVRFCV